MLVQQDIKIEATGFCSDCGTMAMRLVECVDRMTHSRLELCEVCWNAYRQRQVFSSGCCG
ncbi:MAG: hypothetical protein GDA67_01870 [Nitrospira sp. CR1.3]|nr:hypothetical protein [Nitrospira sp. CR1.3]